VNTGDWKDAAKIRMDVLLDEIVIEGVSCGGSIAQQQLSVEIAGSLPMHRDTKQLSPKDCLCRMDFQSRREAVASGNSDNQHNAGRHRWADSWFECTTVYEIVKNASRAKQPSQTRPAISARKLPGLAAFSSLALMCRMGRNEWIRLVWNSLLSPTGHRSSCRRNSGLSEQLPMIGHPTNNEMKPIHSR
jgi:hypothetical protein